MNMVYYIYLYFILIRIKTISTKNKNLYKINKFSKININKIFQSRIKKNN